MSDYLSLFLTYSLSLPSLFFTTCCFYLSNYAVDYLFSLSGLILLQDLTQLVTLFLATTTVGGLRLISGFCRSEH